LGGVYLSCASPAGGALRITVAVSTE
jgi:hypothetical protein